MASSTQPDSRIASDAESIRRLWPAALLLAALTVALFARFVFLGQALIPADILATWYPWKHYLGEVTPHNRLLSDVIDTFYPQDAFFISQLRQGVLPLWDPTVLGGHPSLANGWSAELYPPRLFLLAVFPEWVAHGLNLMLHVFLAGFFSLLLLRRLGVGLFGALVGAVAWMLNGYVMVWLEYGHTVATAALLPLVLLLYEESARRRSPAWAALAGVIVALSLLSGSIQRGLYLLVALSAYLVYRLVVSYLAERRLRSLLWPLGSYVLAVAIGFALSAVVLLPTLELIGYSQRSTLPLSELFPRPWLRLGLLAAFVAPGIAGGPTYPLDLYRLALTNANEFQGYAGLLPLVLALAALGRRRGPALFFGLLALLSLLLALGTPLYLALYYLVPGFNKLGPQRILILYAFGVAMLAGFGADHLAGPAGPRLARRLRTGLAALLAIAVVGVGALNLAVGLGRGQILGYGREYVRTQVYDTPLNPRSLEEYYREVEVLYDRLVAHFEPTSPAIYLPVLLALGCLAVLLLRERRPQLFPAACVALTACDLLYFATSYNTAVDPATLYPKTPGVDFLLADPSLYRVALDTGEGTLFPDTLQPFGIQEVGGYESLYPDRYADLLASIESGRPTTSGFGNLAMLTRLDSPLLDLLNVKYVLRPPDAPPPGEGFALAYRHEMAIYENRRALPRAFVAPECRVAPDGPSALAALFAPDFRPERTVVLEAGAGPTPVCRDGGAGGQATVLAYAPHEVTVRTSAPGGGGWLVLSDTYYPGWRATVDGAPARIYRADYTLRAVELPPGEHVVRFVYAPESFRAGLAISLVATALVLGCLVVMALAGS